MTRGHTHQRPKSHSQADCHTSASHTQAKLTLVYQAALGAGPSAYATYVHSTGVGLQYTNQHLVRARALQGLHPA